MGPDMFLTFVWISLCALTAVTAVPLTGDEPCLPVNTRNDISVNCDQNPAPESKCGNQSLAHPYWECFLYCSSGSWPLDFASSARPSRAVSVSSPLLCATTLHRYALTVVYEVTGVGAVSEFNLTVFVRAGGEAKGEVVGRVQSTTGREARVVTIVVNVSSPNAPFQLVIESSFPDLVHVLSLHLAYAGPLMVAPTSLDALWTTGLVVALVLVLGLVIAVVVTVVCWRRYACYTRGAETDSGGERSAEATEAKSRDASGRSPETAKSSRPPSSDSGNSSTLSLSPQVKTTSQGESTPVPRRLEPKPDPDPKPEPKTEQQPKVEPDPTPEPKPEAEPKPCGDCNAESNDVAMLRDYELPTYLDLMPEAPPPPPTVSPPLPCPRPSFPAERLPMPMPVSRH